VKVAVLEYLCGGGLQEASESASSSLTDEGLAMLCSLANDLALCGHDVHTFLDHCSIYAKTHFIPQVHVHSLGYKGAELDWLEQWSSMAIACDLAIVIAPELDHQLSQIVEHLRKAGAKVLAPSAPFLAATSDKLTTAMLLVQSKIAHPATQTLTEFQARVRTKSSALPLTLKRRDGAGCADMMVFADQGRLLRWLSIHESLYRAGDDWLVQEWLPGRPASMAVIASLDWQIIGAVEQAIRFDTNNEDGCSKVCYVGGAGPMEGVTDEIMKQLAKSVRQAFPVGAAGWIGIDFLVPSDPTKLQDYVVVEINPRLTTSYLGYRKWYGPQLASALLKTPDNPTFFSETLKTTIEFSASEFKKNRGET